MPDAIPVRTILDLFERPRSKNWLGGPYILKKMQKEYNLLWVVISIDTLEIFDLDVYSYDRSTAEMELTHKGCNSPAIPFAKVRLGMKVHVKSNIQVKRHGIILEFHQEVVDAFLKHKYPEETVVEMTIVRIILFWHVA